MNFWPSKVTSKEAAAAAAVEADGLNQEDVLAVVPLPAVEAAFNDEDAAAFAKAVAVDTCQVQEITAIMTGRLSVRGQLAF